MANRLTRIVTRTGDDGTTGLGDGTRVGKDSARVEAMGDIDELNCAIGVVLFLVCLSLTYVNLKYFRASSEYQP